MYIKPIKSILKAKPEPLISAEGKKKLTANLFGRFKPGGKKYASVVSGPCDTDHNALVLKQFLVPGDEKCRELHEVKVEDGPLSMTPSSSSSKSRILSGQSSGGTKFLARRSLGMGNEVLYFFSPCVSSEDRNDKKATEIAARDVSDVACNLFAAFSEQDGGNIIERSKSRIINAFNLRKRAKKFPRKKAISQAKVKSMTARQALEELKEKLSKSTENQELITFVDYLLEQKLEWLHDFGYALTPPDEDPQVASNLAIGTATENTNTLLLEILTDYVAKDHYKLEVTYTSVVKVASKSDLVLEIHNKLSVKRPNSDEYVDCELNIKTFEDTLLNRISDVILAAVAFLAEVYQIEPSKKTTLKI